MKAIDQDSAETSADQSPTLIDCLQCGYDLGDGSAARCPECGRKTSQADAQIRAERRELNDGGSVGIPLLVCFGGFVASVVLAAVGNTGAESILLFVVPLLAPFLFGVLVFAVANTLLSPHEHRSLVFRAWIPTTPRLALWLAAPLGLVAIAWSAGVGIALGPNLEWSVFGLTPIVLFVVMSIALYSSWRRSFLERLERLGLEVSRPAELMMYIAAAIVGLTGPVLLSLSIICILSQIAHT